MEPQIITRLNWGIVGPGSIAREFIRDMKQVDICVNTVAAVMSPRLQDAERFAREYHIPFWCDDLDAMLEQADVDVVYIASPHVFHYAQTLQCLEHHVPVLCEKPLALNLPQAEEMIRAAKNHHTFLMEGMWIRFLPSLLKVLEWLEIGKIGSICSLTANMSFLAPKDSHNRFFDPALGGGSLLDLGIYPVYISQLLLGTPMALKATARLSAAQIDESCAMIFDYPSAYSILESSIVKRTDNQAIIFGDRGMITILAPWNEKSPGIRYDHYRGESEYCACHWPGRGFQFEITEVVRCLSLGEIESTKHAHQDSLRLMRLLDEVRDKTHIHYPAV
jgi:predicted dehydrogenase